MTGSSAAKLAAANPARERPSAPGRASSVGQNFRQGWTEQEEKEVRREGGIMIESSGGKTGRGGGGGDKGGGRSRGGASPSS